MKLKLFLISLFVPAFIFAQNVKIDGTLANGSYTKISILDVNTGDSMAESEIEDGKFNFDFALEKEDIVAIFLDNRNYELLVLKPGEEVIVNYDVKGDVTVEGSTGTELYLTSLGKYKELGADERKDFILGLMKDNPGELAVVLYATTIDTEGALDEHLAFLASLNEKHEGNAFVDQYSYFIVAQQYKNKTKSFEGEQPQVGDIAPEIAMLNPDGELTKLSDLKGQYVLIDFWAAWCGPCRRENPNVVAAYNKYHEKGFTVFGVSLDQTKSDWVAAIEKDKLEQWPHVSDLQGWSNVSSDEYGVNSIPANFLIDPDGKVIATNLRGQDLEDKLEEIFNK